MPVPVGVNQFTPRPGEASPTAKPMFNSEPIQWEPQKLGRRGSTVGESPVAGAGKVRQLVVLRPVEAELMARRLTDLSDVRHGFPLVAFSVCLGQTREFNLAR
jgi:hypothetical protein